MRRRIVVVFNASTSPMKEGYAVSDNNVIKLAQPGVFTDSLTEVLRSGARALLTQAVEAEVAEFVAKHADLKTEKGHQRVVRHGHLPEREIMTGVGPVDGRFSVAVATSQRSKPSDGHSTATDLVTNTNRGVQAGRRANLVPWRGHWGNGTLRGWVARDIARGRCELSPNFGDGVKDQAAAWA